MASNYRQRIYHAYVSARIQQLPPIALKDFRSRRPQLQNIIRRHFPSDRDATILDLGCGDGALVHFAKQLGYRNILGVDASAEQVKIATKLCIQGIKQGDIMDILTITPNESFDCLIAYDLIEHFNRNELITLTDSVLRVLKLGGRWIIHTPNAESPFGMKMRYGDITHEIAFTRRSLAQFLLSSGFARMECIEDQPVPHGIKSSARWLLWQAFRNLLRFYIAVETGDIGRDAIFSQNLIAVAFK